MTTSVSTPPSSSTPKWAYEWIELLMNEYNWNIVAALSAYEKNKRGVMEQLQLDPSILSIQAQAAAAVLDLDAEPVSCPICMENMSAIPMTKPVAGTYATLPREGEVLPSIKCASNHILCSNCWAQHASTQVDSEGKFIIPCPMHKCKQILNAKLFGEYLLSRPLDPNSGNSSSNSNTSTNSSGKKSKDKSSGKSNSNSSNISSSNNVYSRLLTLRQRHVIDCYNKYWKFCPRQDCNAILLCQETSSSSSNSSDTSPKLMNILRRMPKEAPRVNSRAASGKAGKASASAASTAAATPLPFEIKVVTCAAYHSTCMSCNEPAHVGVDCEQLVKWREILSKRVGENDGVSVSEVADKLWLAANTKQCPHCSASIEKNDGCNHMTCRKCRHEFCWICMQKWSLHSMNTGGSFQCNRSSRAGAAAVANEPITGNKRRAKSGDIMDEIDSLGESGSAEANSKNARLRAKATSIFIDHFSRYKAQDDSLKMEIMRMPETIERVCRSLVNSYDNLTRINNSSTHNKIVVVESTMRRDTPNSTIIVSGKKSQDRGITRDSIWLQGDRVRHPLAAYIDSGGSIDIYSLNASKETMQACLGFLQEGFHELVRCRETLKGMALYSYFNFGKLMAHEAANNPKQKAAPENAKLIGHKKALDELISTLGQYTEMLSDVVARKWLRASKAEIENITRLAKNSRVEIEELLYKFEEEKAPKKAPAGKAGKSGGSSASKPAQPVDDNEVEWIDFGKIGNFFGNMFGMGNNSRSSAQNAGGSHSNSNSNLNSSSSSASQMFTPGRPSASASAAYGSSTSSSARALSSLSSSSSARPVEHISLLNPSSNSNQRNPTPTFNIWDSDDEIMAAQMSSLDGNLSTPYAYGGPIPSPFTSSSSISAAATGAASSSSSSSTAFSTTREPSIYNIDTLVSMGFNRAVAISTLKRCDDDLDRAINALL